MYTHLCVWGTSRKEERLWLVYKLVVHSNYPVLLLQKQGDLGSEC